MAPEQVRGMPEPASDLYGLGVSLLCAAYGSGPDKLPSDRQTGGFDVDAIRGLPRHLVSVLERLVAPGLGQRFSSAAEALVALTTAPAPPAHSDAPIRAAEYTTTVVETATRADREHASTFRGLSVIGIVAGGGMTYGFAMHDMIGGAVLGLVMVLASIYYLFATRS